MNTGGFDCQPTDCFPNILHALNAAKCTKLKESLMKTGTVKFFNQSKGFGFITCDDGGKDHFVHISAVEASGCPALNEGDRVSFDSEADKRGKGDKAVNLKMLAE